jgi:DNA-binding LacI/PurR family transcriptional regulator
VQATIRRTTIADVAKAAGVSKTAVSFAFNAPDRLRDETVLHIHDIATAMGYRPDPVARSLAQRRTGTLGILTPQSLDLTFINPYHALFAAGVAAEAERAGLAIQFISPLHGSLARAVDRASVDGIIAVGLGSGHPEVVRIRRSGMRLVVVDSAETDDEPSISVDDEGGARTAARHLLDLGHRRFLILSVEPPARSGGRSGTIATLRLRGYQSALRDAGVELPEEHVIIAPTTIEGGRHAFREAWENGLRPTAVLAMSDVTAIGAIHAARELQVRVPDDVSMVGFDDIEMAQYTDPPLTTIHQPIHRKGEEAVRLLLRDPWQAEPGRSVHQRLDVRLVIRGTTGQAPPKRQGVRDTPGSRPRTGDA